MAGVAGSTIGIAGNQPQIGPYVQDALSPTASNNFIGIDAETAYKTNVLGESIGFIDSFSTHGAAAGKDAVWVRAAGALDPTVNNRVNIAAGVATYNVAGTHDVKATAVANDYLWVFER